MQLCMHAEIGTYCLKLIIISAAGAVRSQVFESREMSRSAKMLVYKAMIEPTLTYGAESCMGTKGEGETKNSGS